MCTVQGHGQCTWDHSEPRSSMACLMHPSKAHHGSPDLSLGDGREARTPHPLLLLAAGATAGATATAPPVAAHCLTGSDQEAPHARGNAVNHLLASLVG
jgi:hypothetical protein